MILETLYLMIPAYVANMTPVIVRKLKFLDSPIDFGAKVGGKAVFGKHKTWRGLFFGVIAGIFFCYLQSLMPVFGNALVDHTDWLVIGFLLSFGALIGDCLESFFKRQIGIKEGGRFIPFDQLDYIIGSLVFLSFYLILSFKMILIISLISFVGHIVVNHLAFYTGIRNEKW